METPNTQANGTPIGWYRVPIPKEKLRELNARSNLKGFIQAGGVLLIYTATASLAIVSYHLWNIWTTIGLIFLHGTIQAFLLNGFHELCHNTVFRSRWLNACFLRIYAFLGLFNYVAFQESHRRHHQYTLHPPDDLEVVLPISFKLKQLLLTQFINVLAIRDKIRELMNASRGKISGEWNERILPAEGPSRRKEFIQWARIMSIGHGLIILVSLSLGNWIVPLLISLSFAYGRWLRFLCNETQHVGLRDNVNDFRLCCRTIYLNPLLQFLYFQMNFHIEHHMYAGVPCYNLPRLHRLIKDQLPPTPRGIIPAWRQIAGILKRQQEDPSYQYTAPLPPQP
jgi:fatty acid desaturase